MNTTNSSPAACPKCGATLPSEATAGLCPACLMAEAMAPTQTGPEPHAARPPMSPEDLAPHFPHLEILACLGRGGMGVVYKARQKSLNRVVALKLLAPERVGDAGFAERFQKEAQALAALNHPHIVTVYDFGLAGGFYFLLMEFVDGVNLRQAMRAGRFTPEQALAIVPPVCEALQYAHEHGIVHRDIKPENLLLDKEGRVKIADFGIAKMVGSGPGGEAQPASAAGTVSLTGGTPQYMAPEQKDRGAVDHRADIYSLGVVLYELLTGELPADGLQPPSRRVQIDVRLDEVVLRALEKDPDRRYQHASEVKTMVETITQTPTSGVRAPDPGWAPATRERSRWLLAIRAVVSCVVCAVFGLHLYPPIVGVGIAAWGLAGAVVVGRLTFGARRNRDEDRVALARASMVGTVHAIGMLAAGLWLALINQGLNPEWNHFLAGLCACGIVVLAVRLARGAVSPPIGSVAAATGGRARAALRPRLMRFLLVTLPATVVLVFIVNSFLLQSFIAATDAVAPEVPRGSRVVVWKRAQSFTPGDCIAYRRQGGVCLGRVVRAGPAGLVVRRNGESDAEVPRGDVMGEVITVLWRGSKAARPDSAQRVDSSFGPVVEREICFNSVTSSPNRFLDLDSGRFVTPSPGVGLDFAREDWIGRYQGVDSRETGAAMQDWVRRSGADVLVDGGQRRLTLLGGWGFDQDARDAHLVEFDRADPGATLRRLAEIDEEMRDNANRSSHVSFLHPPDWYSDGREPGRRMEGPQPHDTVLFRTAAGSMGILQFGAFRENPPRASVRYRLVQRGPGDVRLAASPVAADATPVFGPVVERNFGVSFPWTNCWALNLAAGHVMCLDLERPPPDANNMLAVAATGQPDFPLSLDRRMPSLRAAHVDLMQHMAANIPDMLLTLDMRLIRLTTNEWDISAAEAAARLAPVAAAICEPAEEAITGEHVYLFATRDGARGILQIMRESTHLRYKLLHGGVVANLTPGFGPVIERELVAAPYRGRQDALDLDEGGTRPVPGDLIQANNPRPLLEWLAGGHLDLLIRNTPAEDYLGLHLGDGFLIRAPPGFAFDGIGVGEVARHQAKTGPLQYVMLPKSEIDERPVFLFQTREGGRGVLQVTGLAPDAGTVKLRYKLVRGGARGEASAGKAEAGPGRGSDAISPAASGGRLLEVGMIQDVVNDVQPDGSICFDLTTTERNDRGRPLTTISFVNSDFIRVDRMADARGGELRFTTRREGRMTMRYEAALADPVAPGAECTYVTQGMTTGQVVRLADREVFEYSMRHWPATDVRVRRIERHLLPAGAELLASEPVASLGTNAAGRVVLTIDRLIPKGDSLETCYRYRLRTGGATGGQEGASKP